MKVVINKCYGGFSLSKEAYRFMGIEWDEYGMAYRNCDNDNKEKRTDAKLIECVETLGKRANGLAFEKIRIERSEK